MIQKQKQNKFSFYNNLQSIFLSDRNRPESVASSIMNEQYRQEQSRGNRSRQGSITSASSLRSYKGRNMAGYAIETSFCGAKPLVNPSSYDLSGGGGQQSDGDRSTPPKRINQSEESLTGK